MKRLTIIFLAAMMLAACNTEQTPTAKSKVEAESIVYGCKDDAESAAETLSPRKMAQAYPGYNDTVYFVCTAENTLQIRCQELINCADVLEAEATLSDGMVTLKHTEMTGVYSANCLCPNPVEHNLKNLPYGKYTIRCNSFGSQHSATPNQTWEYALDFTPTTYVKVPLKEITK